MCISHNTSGDLLLPSKQGPPPWQGPPLCHHDLAKTGSGQAMDDEWTAGRKNKKQKLKLKNTTLWRKCCRHEKKKAQRMKERNRIRLMEVMGGITLVHGL